MNTALPLRPRLPLDGAKSEILRKQKGRIDFVYLHVAVPQTNQAREPLGFVATPQNMLLDAKGTKDVSGFGS